MKNRLILLISDIAILILTIINAVWNIINNEIFYAIGSFISAICWIIFAVMITKNILKNKKENK